MKKKKLNLKNKHVQKRIEENPSIEKKEFKKLIRKAVKPSKPSR